MNPKDIRLDSVCIERTYGGVLEGLPTPEQVIDSARNRAKELWGRRATLVVPPVLTPRKLPPSALEDPYIAKERCPAWTISAWLNGPNLKGGDGSELVLIWFQDTLVFEIPGEIMKDLELGTWEKYAEDWEI